MAEAPNFNYAEPTVPPSGATLRKMRSILDGAENNHQGMVIFVSPDDGVTCFAAPGSAEFGVLVDVSRAPPVTIAPGQSVGIAGGATVVPGDVFPVVQSGAWIVGAAQSGAWGVAQVGAWTCDVPDRPARMLGAVSFVAGSSVDVTDRVARALGVVTLGAAADVSDRAGRLLGVADVSDRGARALGVVANLPAALAGSGGVKVDNVPAAPTATNSSIATAPAAAALIADTGALAAGAYRIKVQIGYADTLVAGKCAIFEYRNAANGATLQQTICPAGAVVEFVIERITVLVNERFRVINGAVVGAAGSRLSAWVTATPIG